MWSRRTGVGVVLAALVLGSCGGSDEGSERSTTSTTTRSTTSTSEQGTGPATTGTSDPQGDEPTQGFDSARAAIDHFVGAWTANDEAAAQTGATAVAVQNVFTQPGAGFTLYGCDTGEFDTSTCNYRNRATQGYASITAQKAPIGWIVTDVYMTIDN
jgi:hypothetical protein